MNLWEQVIAWLTYIIGETATWSDVMIPFFGWVFMAVIIISVAMMFLAPFIVVFMALRKGGKHHGFF